MRIMKRETVHTPSCGVLNKSLLLALFGIVSVIEVTMAQTLPADAARACTVKSEDFARFFESGTVTANGIVLPADSLNFPDQPNCSFYEWSWHMFLWLTSPAPFNYGGGGRVFNSGVFFDVSPLSSNGKRSLTALGDAPGDGPNSGLRRKVGMTLNVRNAKPGAHGLPASVDKSGKLIELQRVQLGPNGRALIPTESGKLIEFERIKLGEKGKPIFLDKSGTPIRNKRASNGNAIVLDKFGEPVELADMKSGPRGEPVFLNPFGDVIGIDQGQAASNGGNGVLIAQNGSLVYYATMVNDVYAAFVRGTDLSDAGPPQKGIVPRPTRFPTTFADLASITRFHGTGFPDAKALAVEIKTAWVESVGLDKSKYITIKATIPTYNKSSTTRWTPAEPKETELALVGIHVVGSTGGNFDPSTGITGHPEMIWSTFEHIGNAPNATYDYVSSANNIMSKKTVPQDTGGAWLFSSSFVSPPFNVHRASFDAATQDIIAEQGQTIGPSEVLRWKPWGAASDLRPNPAVPDPAGSNTEIISINNNIVGMLSNSDIRKNYILTGATWTVKGGNPIGPFVPPFVPEEFRPTGMEVGTDRLANTTMETFQQGINGLHDPTSSNCFTCHKSNTTEVSHIFKSLLRKPTP